MKELLIFVQVLAIFLFYSCDIGLSDRKDLHLVNCQFVCYELEGDSPSYQLRLVFETTHMELGEINVCDTIPKSDYNKLNIPQNVINAAGGPMDLFYVLQENDSIKVFKNLPPEDSNPLQYEVIRAFSRLAL